MLRSVMSVIMGFHADSGRSVGMACKAGSDVVQTGQRVGLLVCVEGRPCSGVMHISVRKETCKNSRIGICS